MYFKGIRPLGGRRMVRKTLIYVSYCDYKRRLVSKLRKALGNGRHHCFFEDFLSGEIKWDRRRNTGIFPKYFSGFFGSEPCLMWHIAQLKIAAQLVKICHGYQSCLKNALLSELYNSRNTALKLVSKVSANL